MATHRTISPNSLTDLDRSVLEYCKQASLALMNLIQDPEAKRDFMEKYAKVSNTRDAGAGRGGGKLHRDALTTRGKTDKTPVSNRNLRWHPLVVAAEKPPYAEEVQRIDVREDFGKKELVFTIRNEEGGFQEFTAKDTYLLPRVFVALTSLWQENNHKFQEFTDEDWSNNRCVIPAMEYCNWQDALETYCSLALATVVEVYGVEFSVAQEALNDVFKEINSIEKTAFPTSKFPTNKVAAVSCPLCKKPFSEGLDEFRYADRLITWQAPWSPSKRSEGEDASLQIMHVAPLNEFETNHNAENVRFGHRWCNVSMTDHSLDETIAFFDFVRKQH